jgi:hypothetical protein
MPALSPAITKRFSPLMTQPLPCACARVVTSNRS